jgi:nicotinate-nucleotide adenylyltransferase
MHVALFGGSFNPPHVAHQLAVTYLLATQPVDQVWVAPTASHAFGKPLAPFADRVAMLELALRDYARVKVCTVEADLPPPSRTLDTVRELKRRHPGLRLSLVVGADILPQTPQWKGWPQIQQEVEGLVVLGRAGFPGPWLVVLPDVSSTQVRGWLAAGAGAEKVMDRQVLDYAVARGLYGRGQEV